MDRIGTIRNNHIYSGLCWFNLDTDDGIHFKRKFEENMAAKITENKKPNGSTHHIVADERAETPKESDVPAFEASITINLGGSQFLKVQAHRGGDDVESLKKQVIQDLVDLKDEFKRRKPDLFS